MLTRTAPRYQPAEPVGVAGESTIPVVGAGGAPTWTRLWIVAVESPPSPIVTVTVPVSICENTCAPSTWKPPGIAVTLPALVWPSPQSMLTL